MWNHWSAFKRGFLSTRYVREVVDAAFRARCRYHYVSFDRQDAERAQAHTLTWLIHRAQATRFGREHDFRRIRTADDYRRLVPLTTAQELWHTRWEPALPHLNGATWPGTIALTGSPARPLPCTPALLESTRAAYRTALSMIVESRPAARLLSGQLLFLGDDLNLRMPGGDVVDASECLPYLARAYSHSSADLNYLEKQAEKSAISRLTVLAGSIDRIKAFIELGKHNRGMEKTFSGLGAVIYSHRPGDAARAELQAEVGSRTLLMEANFRPEGPIAIEDPRHGALRLLHDHRIFFEFIPVQKEKEPRPQRLGLGEIQTGVDYELVVSTPAGLWACRLGSFVRFESLKPLLLTLVPPAAKRPARRTDLVPPTIQPLHPRSGDIQATPPGTIGHIPWSTPADRG